jgi:hypothetical protein
MNSGQPNVFESVRGACFAGLPGPHRAVLECVASWYWLRDLLVPAGIDLRAAK